MNRFQLEHVIRAAGTIAEVKNLIILGSQSLLGQFPTIPQTLLETKQIDIFIPKLLYRSMEVDLLVPNDPAKTELLEACLGELSQFHETYGYYVQGVDYQTATLPIGWQERFINICNQNTHWVTGHCLEIHDLILSKLVAGRDKDFEFFRTCIILNIVTQTTLLERLQVTELSSSLRDIIEGRIQRGFQS
jgi:hypothetical protein